MGALAIACGFGLAARALLSNWHLVKVAGTIDRLGPAAQPGRVMPAVTFRDRQGAAQTFLSTPGVSPSRYAAGDAVAVLYDLNDPRRARIADPIQDFSAALMAVFGGALLLLFAGIVAPSSALGFSGARPRPDADAADLQFHPFNAVAVKHYLAEVGLPDGRRKVRLTDASQALSQGRIPVALAEYLAYVSALCFHDDPVAYLATHCPRVFHAAAFARDDMRALALMFEGHAVIALSETAPRGPMSCWTARLLPCAGARRYVPQDVVWDAAPRNRTAARAWDGVRGDVETWFAKREGEGTPILFTGYGLGGAMALLAAYEFAKRGRKIAGIVTFASTAAGATAFAADYASLGLDEKTVHAVAGLEGTAASGSTCRSTGRVWRLPPIPAAALKGAVFMPSKSVFATLAHSCLVREAAAAPPQRGALMRIALGLLSLSPEARRAIARHVIERRYALSLSLLMRNRLRELLAAGDPSLPGAAFSDHLLDIRGVRPEAAGEGFVTLTGLPSVD